MTRLGFIGTGHLASFFVEGLKRAGADYAITVSERNREHSAHLKQAYGVAVASTNQQIADACDLVVVSVLPQQVREALAPVNFRTGQVVLSVMAGVSLAVMKELAAPAGVAVSMMPGLANAHNAGPSALYPDVPAARKLLEKLGPVHAFADEQSYTTASVVGAFSGMSVLMMRDAANWFTANGLSPQAARRMDLTIKPDPMPEQGSYYRSDHFSLARVGVPSFSVEGGMEFAGKPEGFGKELFEEYNSKHYHQPSDEYHEDWDFSGLEQIARFGFLIGVDAANQDKLPTWRKGDEFLAAREKSGVR